MAAGTMTTEPAAGMRGVEDVVALEDEETGRPSWACVSERPRLRAAASGLVVELEPPLEPPLELAPPRGFELEPELELPPHPPRGSEPPP